MSLTFDGKAHAEMVALQRKLAEVLQRANRDGMEAAVAAFALVRLARELLDKYPEATRAALVNDVVVRFLQHAEPEKSSIITIN